MTDIVRVEGEYYVRASSALADDRTRVLKHGDTFAIFNRYGDIEAFGPSQFGLFHAESRYLSRFTMRVNQQQPLLLSSTIREDNAFLSVDLTNLDSPVNSDDTVPRGTVHIFRLQFLREASCYQHIRLLNYDRQPVRVSLFLQFGADFADIFEVRGTKCARKGERLPDQVEGDAAILAYKGLDGVVRRTRLEFSPRPASLTTREACFQITLEPKEEKSIFSTVSCERNPGGKQLDSFHRAFPGLKRDFDRTGIDECRITTTSETFNAWLTRSAADLRMLIEGNPEGPYPYAGVPWFNTVFGRDGIITALECLWIAPRIAEGVLKYLAETQATEEIAEQDAEPGKILHEMRRGEMAVMKEVPFARQMVIMASASRITRTCSSVIFWPCQRSERRREVGNGAARPLGPQNRESILAARILMVFSASIVLTLGVLHLVYTFWGPSLTPRDPALQISMSQSSPIITKETTMWRCWVGFNASHSLGLILFGLVFGYLALAHGQLLFRSPFLLVVGLAMLAGFVLLCWVYFFSVPLIGISISLACYVASISLSRT